MRPNAAQHQWAEGVPAMPDKRCPEGCGAVFFTRVGLAEHASVGCASGHSSVVRRRRAWPTEAQRVARSASGLAVTALNNARRFKCGGCDKVSTPGGLGSHQHATGHVGRVEQ